MSKRIFKSIPIFIVIFCFILFLYIGQRHHKAKKIIIASTVQQIPSIGKVLEFGIYTDKPDVSQDEKILRSRIPILGWFVHWDTSIANNKLRYACNNRYLPLVTWESWKGKSDSIGSPSYPLMDIANGRYDDFIKQQLTLVSRICKNQEVIIRFDHEMDKPTDAIAWTPWQGDPTLYVKVWQRIVSLSHAIDSNIKWLWSPNRGTELAATYYPGNDYVDYVGLTLNRSPLETATTFQEFYTKNDLIEQYKKPIIIGETTFFDDKTDAKAKWIEGMFSYARSNKQIAGLVWFNGSQEYSYGSSQSSIEAFKRELKS